VAQVTVDVLAAHLADYPAGLDGLIFTNNRGEPWRRGTFSEIIRNARAAADLPASLTFHDLRHHFASVLIAAGCSIKAVQVALGHANASETLDTYSHLWPADDDRIRRAIPPRPDTSARVRRDVARSGCTSDARVQAASPPDSPTPARVATTSETVFLGVCPPTLGDRFACLAPRLVGRGTVRRLGSGAPRLGC
jgi:hypothetical protein